MEYPFKDLLPLDEVLEREGYYKDWTHLDPEVFYSLTQISEYIKTKGYGVDVRLLMAQLAEHFGLKTTQVVDLANLLQDKFDNLEGVTSDFTSDINGLVAQMQADKDAVIANVTVDSEVILARGGNPTLGARLERDLVTMQEVTINAKTTFGLIPDEDNASQLLALLSSEYEHITIPSGTYHIDSTLNVTEGAVKKVVGSGQVTFIIDLPINTDFLKSNINIEFDNITFDFNGGFVKQGILFARNLGVIKQRNLRFKNLHETGKDYGTNILQIPAQGNTVDIDNIEFENMTKMGNGIIEDSAGNLTCIYYGDNPSYPSALKGKIENIKATNLKNINETGEVINEDVSAIYAYNTDIHKDGQLLINEIQGYNFGKRLLKVDASNVEIGKVTGHSDIDNVTSLVGLNNTNGSKKNIKIGSLKASGLISATLATDALTVMVDSINSEQTKGSALNVSRGGLTVNNLYSNSPRAVYFNASHVVGDVEVKNLTIGEGEHVSEGITVAHSQGVSNLKIGRLIVNNPNRLSSVINTEASSLNKDISIDRAILNLTNMTSIPLRLLGIDGLKIGGISATNDTETQVERLIRLRGCKNAEIGDITSSVKTIACVDIRDKSDSVRIGKVTSPRATYDVTMVDATNVIIRDANMTKLLMNDETARRNLMPELPYTTGTTGNRPTAPKLGHLYYNRTNNLMSVCTSEAVVDGDGVITAPATWSNLTLS